jgi:hypothetical protein
MVMRSGLERQQRQLLPRLSQRLSQLQRHRLESVHRERMGRS